MHREWEDRPLIRKSFSGCSWWLTCTTSSRTGNSAKTSITTSPIDGSVDLRCLTGCRITRRFSRIRDRYGEDIFEALFRRIVEICQKRGLVGSQCRVMTDATLIAADAALNSLVLNEPEPSGHETEALPENAKPSILRIDSQALESDSPQLHRSGRHLG